MATSTFSVNAMGYIDVTEIEELNNGDGKKKESFLRDFGNTHVANLVRNGKCPGTEMLSLTDHMVAYVVFWA